MNIQMSEVALMGVKLYEGSKDPSKLKFSVEESNQIMTDAIIKESVEYAGLTYTEGMKLDYSTYSHPLVKHKLFNLISETITAIVPRFLTNQFDQFIDVKSTAWGDKLYIEVTSPDLFTVSKVANGTVNARRQRLDRRSITLTPVMREIKIYEELYRVLSGRVDWATYINKVALSFVNAIHTDAYTALYDSYNAGDANYFASGSFSAETFVTIAQRVKAKNGNVPVAAFGTQIALSKINAHTGFTAYPGLNSQDMLNEYNKMGYYGSFRGTNLIMMEQALAPNTDNFAISDNFVVIAPSTDKMIKLGFEGQAIVTENSVNKNLDQSLEYTIQQMWDTQVLTAGAYGKRECIAA